MKCPVCDSRELQMVELEKNLPAQRCPLCEGIFIVSSDYFQWLSLREANLPEQPDPEPLPLLSGPTRARQCPFCHYLLLGYKVSHDISFTLDHCGHCNSVWFDRNEWENLKRRNLHDDINRVFTDAWQRRVRQDGHRAAMQAIYEEKFGAADYAEAQRIKVWLDLHPQRFALRAYLNAEDPYQCL